MITQTFLNTRDSKRVRLLPISIKTLFIIKSQENNYYSRKAELTSPFEIEDVPSIQSDQMTELVVESFSQNHPTILAQDAIPIILTGCFE